MKKILRTNPDVGLLLLRVSVGGLMLFHGIHKLTHGLGFYKQMLSEAGLPSAMAYGIPIGEVVAPVMLILGVFTRVSSLLIAFTMLMAIYLAYGYSALTLNEYGGLMIELDLLYFFGSLCLFFTGPGGFSVVKFIGKSNLEITAQTESRQ